MLTIHLPAEACLAYLDGLLSRNDVTPTQALPFAAQVHEALLARHGEAHPLTLRALDCFVNCLEYTEPDRAGWLAMRGLELARRLGHPELVQAFELAIPEPEVAAA